MKKPEEDDEEAVFDEQHAAPPPDSGYANVDDIQLQGNIWKSSGINNDNDNKLYLSICNCFITII